MGKCRLWVNVSWLWSRSSWSSSQLFNFSLGQYVIGQVLTWSTYYMVNLVHQKIDFAHNIIYNWIYPTTRPDRAHRQKQNCIYPRLFGLQIIFQKLTLHKTSSIIGYIPPLGPSGPTDKSRTAYIHDCLTVSTDSLVGDNCKILQFFQSTDSFLWQLSMVHWQLSHWQLSALTVVPTDSCPHWQLSDLTVVRSDSCRIWQLISDSCLLTRKS